MPSSQRHTAWKFRLFLAMLLTVAPLVTAATASALQRSDVASVVKAAHPPTVGEGCTIPGNDDCANATVIGALPYNDAPNTECATDEVGEPASTCTTGSLSVWYRYTSTASELVTVSLVGSTFDTTLMVWEGTCGAFTAVACNDDFGAGLESQASFVATPGTTYYFQIAGFSGDFGDVALSVTSLVFPDCPAFHVDGTFTGTHTQDGRLFRDGVPSDCANKPYPGNFNVGTTMNFETYNYPNPSPDPACVLINFDPNAGVNPCSVEAHLSAYAGSYDPLNQATNFLGDVGSSDTLPFLVTVPGATDLVILANNNTGQTVCDYTFDVIGVPCDLGPPPPNVVEVPTLGQWGLGALAAMLAIAGFLVMRRNG